MPRFVLPRPPPPWHHTPTARQQPLSGAWPTGSSRYRGSVAADVLAPSPHPCSAAAAATTRGDGRAPICRHWLRRLRNGPHRPPPPPPPHSRRARPPPLIARCRMSRCITFSADPHCPCLIRRSTPAAVGCGVLPCACRPSCLLGRPAAASAADGWSGCFCAVAVESYPCWRRPGRGLAATSTANCRHNR
jgi:hypothetical protein